MNSWYRVLISFNSPFGSFCSLFGPSLYPSLCGLPPPTFTPTLSGSNLYLEGLFGTKVFGSFGTSFCPS